MRNIFQKLACARSTIHSLLLTMKFYLLNVNITPKNSQNLIIMIIFFKRTRKIFNTQENYVVIISKQREREKKTEDKKTTI